MEFYFGEYDECISIQWGSFGEDGVDLWENLI